MAENKTQKTAQSVEVYLGSIDSEQRQKDCRRIYSLMKLVSAEEGKMWGDSMIGFGEYHYKYESGREGDWFLTGFSNRKQNITLYIMAGFSRYDDLLAKLGKHKTGKSCLYIKKLSDIDENVLKEMIASSIELVKEKYRTKN